MSDIRKRTGAFGEAVARKYLVQHGYRILETNYSCSIGEIDIVARDDDFLVFIEVRTKRSRQFGTPEESITATKRARLVNLAQAYLQQHEDVPEFWRIDVVAIEVGQGGKVSRIELIKNAVGQDSHI